MSNELITRLYDEAQDNPDSLEWKAADLIEQQQERIEELEAKMADDWCGCVGIHNHRRGVCTTCNKPVIGWWEVAESAIEDLAAAQNAERCALARENVLRKALEHILCEADFVSDDSRIAFDAAMNALDEPSDDSALLQALTDPENQPNQYGVEFGMSGDKMTFSIGNQRFTLDYEPEEDGEFEFMRNMLINAFSTFTHDVKTDDSALREMLKQERERCATVCDRLCDEFADANAADCAEAIRAMEDK